MDLQFPSVLYHYTTMNSLCNILNGIENKGTEEHPCYFFKLWFTCVTYMNDPLEEVFFKQSLYYAFENFQKLNCLVDKRDELQIAFTGLGLNRGDGYAVSLSENHDSLTMWRAYGSNGQGVAIGFDVDKLANAVLSFEKCKFLKMDYKSLNEFIVTFTEEDVQNAYDAIEIEEERGAINLPVFESLYDKYQQVKTDAYKEENEWRIVFNDDIYKKKSFRERNGLIIPYYEVELPLEVIKRFVIGPCAEQDLSKRFLDSMLFYKAHGLKKNEMEIFLSQVPYVLR